MVSLKSFPFTLENSINTLTQDYIHPHFPMFPFSYPLQWLVLPKCAEVWDHPQGHGNPTNCAPSVPGGLEHIYTLYTRILACSILSTLYTRNLSCYEFVNLIAVSYVEDNISPHSFPDFSSYSLSTSSFRMVFEPQTSQRRLIEIPHLELSTQLSYSQHFDRLCTLNLRLFCAGSFVLTRGTVPVRKIISPPQDKTREDVNEISDIQAGSLRGVFFSKLHSRHLVYEKFPQAAKPWRNTTASACYTRKQIV